MAQHPSAPRPQPLAWLLLLPFRLIGIGVEGVFELLRAIVMLPARVLGGGRH